MAALIAACLLVQSAALFHGSVTSLTPVSGGGVIATGDQLAVRLDSSLKPIRTFTTQFQKAMSASLSTDDHWLAVAGGAPALEGGVEVFDLDSGHSEGKVSTFADIATCVIWSASGPIAGSADGTIRTFEFSTGKAPVPKSILKGHSGSVLAVMNLADMLLSAGRDRTIRVWDLAKGTQLRSLTNHTGAVYALGGPAIIDGVPWCASVSEDRTVRIWQPAIGRMVRILRGSEAQLLSLAISPSGDRLAAGGTDGKIRLMDPGSETPLKEWNMPAVWITALAFSKDGKRLFCGTSAGTVNSLEPPLPR